VGYIPSAMTDPRREELKQLLYEERVDIDRAMAESRRFDATERDRDEERSARIAKLTGEIQQEFLAIERELVEGAGVGKPTGVLRVPRDRTQVILDKINAAMARVWVRGRTPQSTP